MEVAWTEDDADMEVEEEVRVVEEGKAVKGANEQREVGGCGGRGVRGDSAVSSTGEGKERNMSEAALLLSCGQWARMSTG